jgi:hypothetical protein
MQFAMLATISLLLLALGGIAGYYLASWIIWILVAISFIGLLVLHRELQTVPAGTSGGIGVGLLMFAIFLFLLALGVGSLTDGFVRIPFGVDLPSIPFTRPHRSFSEG